LNQLLWAELLGSQKLCTIATLRDSPRKIQVLRLTPGLDILGHEFASVALPLGRGSARNASTSE
jgi:hypothetical protein